jgi:ABC-type lipoprotein export system ATPase subunit/ABC-type multidrug transport system permease subunit
VVRPTAGQVLLDGEPLEHRLSDVGYVPQFDILHGQLSVREALEYSARLRLPRDVGDVERAERVQEVIDQLQLGDRADVRLEILSGGQRKRAAVGTELLHQPGVLFLDEPTTGLDPGLERRLMELFRRLANEGQTVALVTHATQSIALCDRVVVIAAGGVLCFDGDPADLEDAFGVESVDGVYLALADSWTPRRAVTSSRTETPPPLPRLTPVHGVVRPAHPFLQQARILSGRYATVLRRDRRHLRSALIQVPILGLLTAFLFKRNVFLPAGYGQLHAATSKSAQLLFLMVTVALWLGSINAAREIVKERNVLSRELAVGVRVSAYIASKLAVMFTLATLQTLLFAVIVLVWQPLHDRPGTGLKLAAILVLASWVGVLCGLLVSAYAATEDQATSIIPLLLVPQLLLGGAIVPLKDMSLPIRLLADVVPARWGFAASGNAIDLQGRIRADADFTRASHYGQHFFNVSFPAYVVVCCLFGVALCAGLGRLLTRPAP